MGKKVEHGLSPEDIARHERIGKAKADGAIHAIANAVILAVIAAVVLSFGLTVLFGTPGVDNSDMAFPSGEVWHSGMKVRIDYATGCQYLESTDGALTPRLDQWGEQFCLTSEGMVKYHETKTVGGLFWKWIGK